MLQLRPATPSDLTSAADTLSLAFANYSWTDWTVAADRHVERIREIQRLCLEHIALPHGLVYVSDDITGVITLTGPGAQQHISSGIWSQIRSTTGDAPADDTDLSLPQSPVTESWELATIGVHPKHRGNGLGSALIAHALNVLDTATGERTPVHLETSDPRNVDLYARSGFVTHAETRLRNGPTVWSMQRE